MRDGALWITKVDGGVTSSATKIYLARRWLPTAMVRPAEGGGETEWGSISSFHPPHPHHLMQGAWTQVNDVRGGGRSRAWQPALRHMANHGHTQHGLGWPLAAVTTAAAAAVVCDTIAMLTMFQTPSTLQGCRCMKSVCRVGARGSTPSLGPILSPATRRGQNHPATRT